MKIKLIRPYSIAGKRFESGTIVEVNEHTAAWLIGEGIAVKAPARNKKE